MGSTAATSANHKREDPTHEARSDDLSQVSSMLCDTQLAKLMYVGGCSRDYTSPCPRGWLARENGACQPPPNYAGKCEVANMTGKSSADKEAFALRCSASWPCSASCRKDFSSCPSGWTNAGSSLCLAPMGYAGLCSPATDFATFSDRGKADWAALCSAKWPCAA